MLQIIIDTVKVLLSCVDFDAFLLIHPHCHDYNKISILKMQKKVQFKVRKSPTDAISIKQQRNHTLLLLPVSNSFSIFVFQFRVDIGYLYLSIYLSGTGIYAYLLQPTSKPVRSFFPSVSFRLCCCCCCCCCCVSNHVHSRRSKPSFLIDFHGSKQQAEKARKQIKAKLVRSFWGLK